MVAGNAMRQCLALLVAPLIAFFASAALAGPGFISSSRISGDEIDIRFNCKVAYRHHEPQQRGDMLRIYLDSTGICNGASPGVAESRGRHRPANADSLQLIDFEYDGMSPAGAMLTFSFDGPVEFTVDVEPISFQLVVRVIADDAELSADEPDKNVLHREVVQPDVASSDYVINLVSFRRAPTVADATGLALAPHQRVFYSQFEVGGATWYRLRLGDFGSADDARLALRELETSYPGAWVEKLDPDVSAVDLTAATREVAADSAMPTLPADSSGDSKADALMNEARAAMVAKDVSKAIQIYTKILQMPTNTRQPEAQELLALAREKNGQIAHAKAEYQRYLSLYPSGEGAARVNQRLAALLAVDRQSRQPDNAPAAVASGKRSMLSDWRLQSFFSQYYRRDVNQAADQNEIVSQSALYSDVNIDARRRGSRFDFSGRLSAGYRNDFLGEEYGSGNRSRISYAYADLADSKTGLRARIGRQSRNTGGVLGRFDGFNLGYQATENMLLSAVLGKPAYSANDGVDSARTFYGTSINYSPPIDGLELGAYLIQQDIDGIDDRQAIGGEFRYFGENQSIWGLVDYDTNYDELGSAFLQTSWRFGSRLSLHGSMDRRHSPFLSTGNALIGQPVLTFAELLEIYPIEEIRQFSLDRSPISTSYTMGLSYTLTPKIQITADTNQTTVDATPASGGVFATPEWSYRYFATNIVASSLLKEGDVTILSIRNSTSDATDVISLIVDSRFPFGRTWQVNPRVRVDRRVRSGDDSDEWIISPGVRIRYRRSQKFRIELEAGRQFSQRDSLNVDLDRESYFINFGYQAFF